MDINDINVDIKEALDQAYSYAARWRGCGEAATFIPELTKEDPNQLGLCVTALNGRQYSLGDSAIKFTIQSISKLILLAAALEDSGFDKVFSKVGFEASGDRFNSLYRLELMNPHPANPMINAGAIAVASCITGSSVEQRIDKVLTLAKRCLGVSRIDCSDAVFNCEMETGYRNQALAQMMRDAKILEGPAEEHLPVYYRSCSMLTDCRMLSYFGALLAGGGVAPGSGEPVLPPQTARLLRVLMASCGLYDKSGQFAVKVGVPAKSGSAGGIMAAAPGKLGIGTFSPLLDSKGNSICGVKALEYLSEKLDLSIY